MSGFTFGDPRFPTCCGQPQGCTNTDADQCPFWNHRPKRTNDPDHPNHIPEHPPQERTVTTMSETERPTIAGQFCGQQQPHVPHWWETPRIYGSTSLVTHYQCAGVDHRLAAPAPAGDSGGERG